MIWKVGGEIRRLLASIETPGYWPQFENLTRVALVMPYMDFDHATIVD